MTDRQIAARILTEEMLGALHTSVMVALRDEDHVAELAEQAKISSQRMDRIAEEVRKQGFDFVEKLSERAQMTVAFPSVTVPGQERP